MKLLCRIDSEEDVNIDDVEILNINDNDDFTYTFWNHIKNLINFYSDEGLDILYLSLFVFAADRLFLREEADDSWSREIELFIPVLSIIKWNEAKELIEDMISFLSGDRWKLHFRERKLCQKEMTYKKKYESKKTKKTSYETLCMLSGGLDSFIGAINLLESTNKDNILFVSHYGGGKGTKEYQDLLKREFVEKYGISDKQFYQNYAAVIHGVEDTTRTRSFMFFSHAIAYATGMAGKVKVIIPENGLISLNIPLTHTRLGTSSTRTTHPYYMKMFQTLIDKLDINVELYNPFQFKTKGEMVAECKNIVLLQKNLIHTMSCSHPDVGRFKGMNRTLHCGYCLPCTIRRASLFKSELTDTSEYSTINYQVGNVARESMNAYRLAIATFKPETAFLRVQNTGPIEENIMEYANLYIRGMTELKTYLEDFNV